jgi:hypothetical protein
MSRKRPWGVVAAPFILGLGLAGFWGTNAAMAMKEKVQDWAYQLEHSSEPVTMVMPSVPLVPPLFVNSRHVGRIEKIVVERNHPRSIDSVQILASVDHGFQKQLTDCSLRLRVMSADPGSLKRALRCTADTDGLVPFGHLEVAGTDLTVPILVRLGDLPCDHEEIQVGPCGSLSSDLHADLHQLSEELRNNGQQIRIELRDVEALKQEIRERVKASIR